MNRKERRRLKKQAQKQAQNPLQLYRLASRARRKT
jgi:hypothetical protein